MTNSPCTRSSHLLLLVILLLDRDSLHLMLFHNRHSWRSRSGGAHAISLAVSVDRKAYFERSQSPSRGRRNTGNLPNITKVIMNSTHSKAPIPADAFALSIADFQFVGRPESTVCRLP